MAEIRRAATPLGRERLGHYTIEGTRLHERALRAGVAVRAVVVSPTLLADPDERVRLLLEGLEAEGAALHGVPEPVIRDLVGGRGHGDLVGLVGLPSQPDLSSVLARSDRLARSVLVAVDLEDPGNAGALVRTALAMGSAALVAVGRTDPFHPRAVQTSRGSLFKLPIVRGATLPSLVGELRELGVGTVGAVLEGGASLADARLDRPRWALFVGSESRGLPEALRADLDCRVTIPMAAGVDSLAVNAAAAVILYELERRGRSS